MRQLFIFLLIVLGFDCVGQTVEEKPNIIVLLVDDLGWGDIGYNNPEYVYTPNLDRLAAQGARLDNHYSMPQCTPTRIATFTGRYPGRFGNRGLQATNQRVFPPGTPNIATMLKNEGYRTYLSGKWHMGCDTIDGPNNHGFDESYGSLSGAVGMYDHRYRPTNKYEKTWHRNHKLIDGFDNGAHATDLITREAERVIQIEDENPFFLFLTYHAPHTPLDERGDFVEQPTRLDTITNRWINEDKIRWFNDPDSKIQQEQDPEKRLLLAAVNHLDFAIGQLINTLEKTGKRENTIILFSSDNGPQVNWPGNAYPDDLKLTNFNQPIPMRGAKVDVWEGGIHVPGFINWPGKIKAKKVKEVVHVIDWLPTLAKLVGHQDSKNYELDGVDIGPVIFNNSTLQDRDLYWIWNNKTNRWALRYDDWKIVKYGIGQPKVVEDWQLFNLKEDPQETTDLAEKNANMAAKLHAMFLKQRAKDKPGNSDLSNKTEQALLVQKSAPQMKIDGKADEKSWQEAEAHSFDFFYKYEKPDDKQQSIFKMLWDEKHLYFFFESTDKFITAREKNRDSQPYFDDCAEIFLIPTADKINMHFGFEVNLYKASNDFVFINDIYKNENFVVKSYSPEFDVATTVSGTINDNSDIDEGWTMEMAIPIEAFNTNGPINKIEAGSRWNFMAIRQDRNDATGNRRSTSTIFPLSPTNQNVHNPESFGIMEFVEE